MLEYNTYKVNATVTKEMVDDLSKLHGIDTMQSIERELVSMILNLKRTEKLRNLIEKLNEKNKKG
jgi:hypothetical protein